MSDVNPLFSPIAACPTCGGRWVDAVYEPRCDVPLLSTPARIVATCAKCCYRYYLRPLNVTEDEERAVLAEQKKNDQERHRLLSSLKQHQSPPNFSALNLDGPDFGSILPNALPNTGASDTTYIKFTVGRLFCGKVRNYLKRLADIDQGIHCWSENLGWLEHEFTVRGASKALDRAKNDLTQWSKETANG